MSSNEDSFQSRTSYSAGIAALMLLIVAIPAVESSCPFGGRFAAAGLFGSNNEGDNMRKHADTLIPPLQAKCRPPPPVSSPKLATNQLSGATVMIPPPPPPKPVTNLEPEALTSSNEGSALLSSEEQTELPTATEWSLPHPNTSTSNHIAPMNHNENPGWPQHRAGAWGAYTQNGQYHQDSYYSSEDGPQQPWPSLEKQLAESVAREHRLIEQVHNLTDTIGSLQQLDQIHIRQMDAITQRIICTEAKIALKQNRSLEYQAHSTGLHLEVMTLRQELVDWQSRCARFADQNAKNKGRIKELKKNIQEARAEAENLAISIENTRFRDIKDGSRRKNKNPRGFFGWVLSVVLRHDVGVDLEDAQIPRELAKSTILRALQLERSNVDELEAIVVCLQQNNSVIAEVVKSRETIINELNDRVAVFEDDKVVLKAALKQLQKEMKEEAPRTEKLVDDLETARQENIRLVEEISALVEMHQMEIMNLQHCIAQSQCAANASESNLTAIGHYVSTLEHRLASFAIFRKDVEVREQKCRETEEQLLKAEEDRCNLRARIEEYEGVKNDLKSLFEELVQSQTIMMEENGLLSEERDSLTQGAQRSREALASLEINLKNRDEEIKECKSKAQELEHELNTAKEEAAELQLGLHAAQAGHEQLIKDIESVQRCSSMLQTQLGAKVTDLSMVKEQFEAKSSELEQKEMMASAATKWRDRQQEVEESLAKHHHFKNELETQGAELAKLQAPTKSQDEMLGKIPLQHQILNEVKASKIAEENGSCLLSVVGIVQNSMRVAPSSQQRTTAEKFAPLPSLNVVQKSRMVPFRQARKLFARVTGVHGAFTRPLEKNTLKRPSPQNRSKGAMQKTPKKGAQEKPFAFNEASPEK